MYPLLCSRPTLRTLAVKQASVPALTFARPFHVTGNRRNYHNDGRQRLSKFWTPTGGIASSSHEDSNDLLVKAGFLRQAYSGIFHMLPLGLRVQDKLEKLVDKHMQSIGASKVSLSSLSAQSLWHKTGRLNKDSDLFKLEDRKEMGFLLAPTHEEEITSLVGGLVKSYRDLPLRLYQIGRKYRDEPRPRQGLLRGREFVMKDLYTFDYSSSAALDTYKEVTMAYVRLFNELKIPYKIAAADTGNIGGSLSHEFHLPSAKGEDTVISCKSCKATWNDELSTGQVFKAGKKPTPGQVNESDEYAGIGEHDYDAISTDMWLGISKDRKSLVRVWYPKFLLSKESEEPVKREANPHAIKAITKSIHIDLDTGVKNPLDKWQVRLEEGGQMNVVDIFDYRVRRFEKPPMAGIFSPDSPSGTPSIQHSLVDVHPDTHALLDCIETLPGDSCPKCGAEEAIETQTAIELGHTFHLGTKYSEALGATVPVNQALLGEPSEELEASSKTTNVPLEMGCHGIGISRIISAIANTMSDAKGLNWPRAIAPYDVVIIADKAFSQQAEEVYDLLGGTTDAIIDDRDKSLMWRMRDADLIGYPVIIVIGKSWKNASKVEVQCRRVEGYERKDESLDSLRSHVDMLLNKL